MRGVVPLKLVVGCPVADRDWALPTWFKCLAEQTRPPDEYVFVISEKQPTPVLDTIRLIRDCCPRDVNDGLSYAMDETPFIARHERSLMQNGAPVHPPEYVYGDFAKRRNRLLQMVEKREPDLFLSLDSDVMLDDTTVIERLVAQLASARRAAEVFPEPEVISPCLFLHPTGPASECYNAALWVNENDPPSHDQPWLRLTAKDAQAGLQRVHIPMAAVLMSGRVASTCRYHYHEAGEDLGFAQSMTAHGVTCLWNPWITVRHVMSPDAL